MNLTLSLQINFWSTFPFSWSTSKKCRIKFIYIRKSIARNVIIIPYGKPSKQKMCQQVKKYILVRAGLSTHPKKILVTPPAPIWAEARKKHAQKGHTKIKSINRSIHNTAYLNYIKNAIVIAKPMNMITKEM